MSKIRVIGVSPQEAYDGTADVWCGGELIVTIPLPGQRRIDSRRWRAVAHRPDEPRARLDETNRLIAAF